MRDRPRPPLDAAKRPGKGVTHGCQPRDLPAFFYVSELLTLNEHTQARHESTASKPVIKHALIIIKFASFYELNLRAFIDYKNDVDRG